MENKSIWNGYPVAGDTAELDYIVEHSGMISLDKHDIISILTTEGENNISTGIASTLCEAFSIAVDSQKNSINCATSLLIYFICGARQADMAEMRKITEILGKSNEDLSILWGMSSDPSLGEKFKVILLSSTSR